MTYLAKLLWRNEEGQDIAEYAVMLAVILVIVIGTVKLIGGNANNVFSQVASSIGHRPPLPDAHRTREIASAASCKLGWDLSRKEKYEPKPLLMIGGLALAIACSSATASITGCAPVPL